MIVDKFVEHRPEFKLQIFPSVGDADVASGADFVPSLPWTRNTIDRSQPIVSSNLSQAEEERPLPSRIGVRLQGNPIVSVSEVTLDSYDSAATRGREKKHVDDVFQEEIEWQVG